MSSNYPSLAKPLAGAVRQAVRLRYYQQDLKDRINAAWAEGHQNVLAVAPTGAGKTVLMAAMVAEHKGGAVLVAHRQELVAQISLALNDVGIRHRLIAPDPVVKLIIRRHLAEHGITFYDANAIVGVGGANTVERLNKGKRALQFGTWCKQVTFWLTDEAHHLLAGNLWGRAVSTDIFPNQTKGLGVTATPGRPDGQGLGRHAAGIMDVLIEGTGMRELIDQGYLCPYKIYTVPYKVNYDAVKIGSGGEYVAAQLEAAEEGSDLIGDIVQTYQRRTPGKRAVCFVSSVKRSKEVAEAFRSVGIASEAVDGTTDSTIRERAVADLASGKIRVLVNADLFGEGTDIPAVEVVIMGTRTASFIRYSQWFGRMLRLFLTPEERTGYDDLDAAGRRARIANSVKPYGILIDHGGNVIYHRGPPDLPQDWSLDNRAKRSTGPSDAVPYRVCANPGLVLAGSSWPDWRAAGFSDAMLIEQELASELELPCSEPYPTTERCCPYCGYQPMPISRSDPEHVDGDLEELNADALAALWAAAHEAIKSPAMVREDLHATGLNGRFIESNVKHHITRIAEQTALRETMAKWGGIWHARGESDSQIQRRFFHTFGIDVLSAQALKRVDAEKLRDKVLTLMK